MQLQEASFLLFLRLDEMIVHGLTCEQVFEFGYYSFFSHISKLVKRLEIPVRDLKNLHRISISQFLDSVFEFFNITDG